MFISIAFKLFIFIVFFSLSSTLLFAQESFDAHRAGFQVKFKNETTPYQVTGVFLLPEERLQFETRGINSSDEYT
ncbi:MAG: hypothetical protein WAN36_14470, partial [Calditrichia bacterium]